MLGIWTFWDSFNVPRPFGFQVAAPEEASSGQRRLCRGCLTCRILGFGSMIRLRCWNLDIFQRSVPTYVESQNMFAALFNLRLCSNPRESLKTTGSWEGYKPGVILMMARIGDYFQVDLQVLGSFDVENSRVACFGAATGGGLSSLAHLTAQQPWRRSPMHHGIT